MYKVYSYKKFQTLESWLVIQNMSIALIKKKKMITLIKKNLNSNDSQGSGR